MKQFKKAQVIMLPTKNIKNSIWLDEKNYILLNHFLIKQKPKGKFQHLYIISDDEIKEGDWCLDTINNILFISDGNIKLHKSTDKKIIATTDTSIYPKCDGKCAKYECVCLFPKPSQQFIKYYIEEYNKGNVITDILVEYYNNYDLHYYTPLGGIECCEKIDNWKLKINPKDNTIKIKNIGETLKDIMIKNPDIRGEVIEFAYKLLKATGKEIKAEMVEIQTNPHIIFSGVDKWIEENL